MLVAHRNWLLFIGLKDIVWNVAFLSSTVPHLPPLVGLIQQLNVEEEQMMTMMMFSSFAIRKNKQTMVLWLRFLVLASTMSPFLTVISLLFLEVKSYKASISPRFALSVL